MNSLSLDIEKDLMVIKHNSHLQIKNLIENSCKDDVHINPEFCQLNEEMLAQLVIIFK